MSGVSESIVREYFELHGFFVRQQRKFVAPAKREEDEVDFLVTNPRNTISAGLPFVLGSADLEGIASAVVVVKGWHTETFSPGLLANAPEIFRFLEPAVFSHAAKAFGAEVNPLKILIVPALPSGTEARDQSVALLRAKGVDAVIPFRTLLADLIAQTVTNRNYQKSDILQLIRIFKNYDFFREPQLELFKPSRSRRARKGRARM